MCQERKDKIFNFLRELETIFKKEFKNWKIQQN